MEHVDLEGRAPRCDATVRTLLVAASSRPARRYKRNLLTLE